MLNNRGGKLFLKRIMLENFLDDMFFKCRNEREVAWLQGQIQDATEVIVAKRNEEIEDEVKINE